MFDVCFGKPYDWKLSGYVTFVPTTFPVPSPYVRTVSLLKYPVLCRLNLTATPIVFRPFGLVLPSLLRVPKFLLFFGLQYADLYGI